MESLKTMKLINQIDTFICKEHTGTPAESVEKIHKSESSIYRLLHVMKDVVKHKKIQYSQTVSV